MKNAATNRHSVLLPYCATKRTDFLFFTSHCTLGESFDNIEGIGPIINENIYKKGGRYAFIDLQGNPN